MKFFAICFVLVMLASCSENDPFKYDLTGAERIDANIVLDNLKNGSVLCNKYKRTTDSCTAVQTLRKVTSEGVVVNFLSGKPFAFKISLSANLRLKNNTLCRKPRESYSTIKVYHTKDDRAERSELDRLGAREKIKEVRENVLDGAEDEEYCWAYYKSNTPSNGLKSEILMVEYIDGVRQPVDKDSRFNFFDKVGSLKLRK